MTSPVESYIFEHTYARTGDPRSKTCPIGGTLCLRGHYLLDFIAMGDLVATLSSIVFGNLSEGL